MQNSDIVKGKWNEVKGEVRKAWGKLTDDDLESTKGDFEKIGGLIQKHYGQTKQEVSDKLKSIRDRYNDAAKKPDPPVTPVI